MHLSLRHSVVILSLPLALVACASTEVSVTVDPPAPSTSSRSSAAAVTPPAPAPVPPAASSAQAVSSKPVNGGASATEVATLAVPFAPQAPFANWDALHQETCEEMSLIMVQRYLKGQSLSEREAEDEVQKLVAWMTDNGYGWDVTAAQIGEIAEKHYGLSARVITNVTIDDIVAELAAGNPVIVPAAGRELGNPYFSGAGPWYHMLVITGYKKTAFGARFVTNDPGTKRGAGYEYDANVLYSAIHDWTGVKEETNTGPKNVVVID